MHTKMGKHTTSPRWGAVDESDRINRQAGAARSARPPPASTAASGARVRCRCAARISVSPRRPRRLMPMALALCYHISERSPSITITRHPHPLCVPVFEERARRSAGRARGRMRVKPRGGRMCPGRWRPRHAATAKAPEPWGWGVGVRCLVMLVVNYVASPRWPRQPRRGPPTTARRLLALRRRILLRRPVLEGGNARACSSTCSRPTPPRAGFMGFPPPAALRFARVTLQSSAQPRWRGALWCVTHVLRPS